MKHSRMLAAMFLLAGSTSPLKAQADLEWSASRGGMPGQPDTAGLAAADSDGNVLVAVLSGVSMLESDVQILKYSNAGVLLWARRFDGGPGTRDVPHGIAVASNGDVCVCGDSSSQLSQLFLVRLDAAGNRISTTMSSGPGNHGFDAACAVAVDARDNAVIAGAVANALGHTDVLVQTRSPLGTLLWEARIDGPAAGDDQAKALMIDSAGDVFVAATMGNGMRNDAAIAKLSADGAFRWLSVLPMPHTFDDTFQTVASDGRGGVLAGGFSARSDGVSGATEFYAALTARCDGSGVYQWVDSHPNGRGRFETVDVLADGAGVCWALHARNTGALWSTLLTRTSPTGARLSAEVLPKMDSVFLLAEGDAGQVFVGGAAGGMDPEPGTQPVLAQYDASGTRNWTHGFGAGPAALVPLGFAQAPHARIVIHGHSASAGWSTMEALVMQVDTGDSPHGFCTGKRNSLGCEPRTVFTGMPRASAASGFHMRVERVRNRTAGLFLYGVHGAASNPFGGGTLCVQSPVRRTPVAPSGGAPAPTTDCSGEFTIDMNAFAHGALGGSPIPELLIPGTRVWMQAWGRDNGFPAPSDVALSGGLTYVVLP